MYVYIRIHPSGICKKNSNCIYLGDVETTDNIGRYVIQSNSVYIFGIFTNRIHIVLDNKVNLQVQKLFIINVYLEKFFSKILYHEEGDFCKQMISSSTCKSQEANKSYTIFHKVNCSSAWNLISGFFVFFLVDCLGGWDQ